MKQQQVTYEEIDQYLNGELKEKRLIKFEERLRTDADFSKEVSLIRDIRRSIIDEEAIMLQKKLQSLGDVFFVPKPKTKKIQYFKHWKLVATIIFLIVSGLSIWQMGQKKENNTYLYAKYYQPLEIKTPVRGYNNLLNSPLKYGIKAYQEKDFDTALACFQARLEKEPHVVITTYYLAHTYLNTTPPQDEKALILFQKIINNQNSAQIQAAQWFLAMLHLKYNRKKATIAILTALVKANQGYYSKLSDKLLKEING